MVDGLLSLNKTNKDPNEAIGKEFIIKKEKAGKDGGRQLAVTENKQVKIPTK